MILKNINLEKGITCILGASGTGKTTLLKTMNKEENFLNIPQKEKILVLQNSTLFPNWNLWENIIEPCKLVNKNYELAELLLNNFQLTDLKNNSIDNLSGGETQRVCLIRAIIQRPKILLLDEPTSALDKKNVSILFENLFSDYIIIATHDKEVIKYANQLILLENNSYILHSEKISQYIQNFLK